MPTVAVLVGREPLHRFSVHRGYVDALWAVGATPLVLCPPPDTTGIERYVEAARACDAVCLTGGGDVLVPPEEGLMDPDSLRDAVEMAVVRSITTKALGICRGIQLLCVALEGTLHRDLPTAGYHGHWEEERQYEPVHAVAADAGSLAARALAGVSTVNSIHHQAVKDRGPSLTATAWSEDGLIEAVEGPGVLGVQWHPERLFNADPRHLAPFEWLVAA